MRRVVILGRGAAGKSTLARQLGDLTVAELDTMFWQPGLTPAEPARWAACQRELCRRASWRPASLLLSLDPPSYCVGQC